MSNFDNQFVKEIKEGFQEYSKLTEKEKENIRRRNPVFWRNLYFGRFVREEFFAFHEMMREIGSEEAAAKLMPEMIEIKENVRNLEVENLKYQKELEDAKRSIKKLTDEESKRKAAAAILEEEKKKELGEISINGKQYVLNRYLAKGAYGTVYLAKKRSTGKKFAIKVVEKNKFTESKFYDRELDNLKSLDHPNIIKFYGAVETWGSEFGNSIHFLLEYAAGGDLHTYICKNDISSAKQKDLFRQIVTGVEYMHSKNFAHRDLKPGNILLDSKGTIKIADFGLAKEVKQEDAQMETVCGTPRYVAPEVFDPTVESYNGTKADMYSLGIILYVIVTKFGKTSLPSECRDLFKKLTNTNPSARPSAAEVLNDPWLA